MKKIFKYKIEDGEISLPKDAEILTVAAQGDGIFLWAVINPVSPLEDKTFYIYGTGHEIEDRQMKKYIGTVFEGPFVWHVFQDMMP